MLTIIFIFIWLNKIVSRKLYYFTRNDDLVERNITPLQLFYGKLGWPNLIIRYPIFQKSDLCLQTQQQCFYRSPNSSKKDSLFTLKELWREFDISLVLRIRWHKRIKLSLENEDYDIWHSKFLQRREVRNLDFHKNSYHH